LTWLFEFIVDVFYLVRRFEAGISAHIAANCIIFGALQDEPQNSVQSNEFFYFPPNFLIFFFVFFILPHFLCTFVNQLSLLYE